MIVYGKTVSAVLTSLHNNGPQTTQELAQSTGIHVENLRSVVSRLHNAPADSPRRIYVSRWLTVKDGKRSYIRAEYAVGSCEDARKKGHVATVPRRSMYSNLTAGTVWAGLI
jgi:hypothetical protein